MGQFGYNVLFPFHLPFRPKKVSSVSKSVCPNDASEPQVIVVGRTFSKSRETILSLITLHTSSAYILWLEAKSADVSRYHGG